MAIVAKRPETVDWRMKAAIFVVFPLFRADTVRFPNRDRFFQGKSILGPGVVRAWILLRCLGEWMVAPWALN